MVLILLLLSLLLVLALLLHVLNDVLRFGCSVNLFDWEMRVQKNCPPNCESFWVFTTWIWAAWCCCCCCCCATTIVVLAEFGLTPPWVCLLCWFNSALVRNPSPHAVQGYAWSPVCILQKQSTQIKSNIQTVVASFCHTYNLICATNVRFCKNSLPQTVQACGTRPCIRPWLTNWNFLGNVAPQSPHTNGLTDPWNRECITKWFSWAKLSPHSSHTYGRSPAWNLLCVTRCRFSGKALPHSWQTNGRSRLCTRECVNKWCFNVKLFLHSLHWYGRSVEWSNRWVFRQCLWAKLLPQCTQTCGRSPVWTRACVVKWCFSKNDLPHSSHEYGRSFGGASGSCLLSISWSWSSSNSSSCSWSSSTWCNTSSFMSLSMFGSNLQCVSCCESSASSRPCITFCTCTEMPSRIRKSNLEKNKICFVP